MLSPQKEAISHLRLDAFLGSLLQSFDSYIARWSPHNSNQLISCMHSLRPMCCLENPMFSNGIRMRFQKLEYTSLDLFKKIAPCSNTTVPKVQ